MRIIQYKKNWRSCTKETGKFHEYRKSQYPFLLQMELSLIFSVTNFLSTLSHLLYKLFSKNTVVKLRYSLCSMMEWIMETILMYKIMLLRGKFV